MLHRDHTADPARRRLNQPTKLGFAWTEQIFRNSAKTFFFLRPRSLTTSIWCLMVSFSWKQISIPANLLHMQPKFTYHVDASLWASEIIYMLLIVSSTSLCSTLHRLHFGSRKREIVDHRKIIMMKQRKCLQIARFFKTPISPLLGNSEVTSSLNMPKLHQLTYSIDRNKISKILVTPIFDGYQKKFKMALKRPKTTF